MTQDNLINIVAITFSALILSELLNVAFEIHTWHWLMVISELLTIVVYFVSMVLLRSTFDISFISTIGFWWRVVVVTVVSCLPPYLSKFLKRKLDPPSYIKVK